MANKPVVIIAHPPGTDPQTVTPALPGAKPKEINVNIVAFSLQGAIAPSALASIEEDIEKAKGALDTSKPVIVTGRGPLWLYGALVHELHYFRAVATWEPRLGAGIVVEGAEHDIGRGLTPEGNVVDLPETGKGVPELGLETQGSHQVLTVTIKGDRFASPSSLKKLAQDIEEIKRTGIDASKPLIISGPMPVWMASFLVVRTMHVVPTVALYDPKVQGAVVVASHSANYKVGDVIKINLPRQTAMAQRRRGSNEHAKPQAV